MGEFLPETVAVALRQENTRPRCDVMGDALILNLRGVNMNPGSNPDDMVSVCLWIADGLIISTRARRIWAMDEIRQSMMAGKGPATIGGFLSSLTHGLTKRIEAISIELEEHTDELEEESFDSPQNLNKKIAPSRHSVIKLRRFIRPNIRRCWS